MHYLVPLVGLIGLIGFVGIQGKACGYAVLALPCYAVVLWLHFNVKAWVPFINPATYDAEFMAVDRQMHGIVDACIAIRGWLATWVPGINDLYMNGFMLLFYCSFIVHSMKTPDQFRTLFLSALLLQGLGGLCYLLFPAIGPFLYETGANPVLTQAQAHMLAVREAAVAGGREWLAANGAREFVSPLGAMPSLHAGGGFLFLWFAWKHCRVLLPLYVPLFAFILIGAIANRFHYIVDLPAGIALAGLSIWLAHRLHAGQPWPSGWRWATLPPFGAVMRADGGLRQTPKTALAKAPATR
ncbi:phosphatase PAP2 family protein [Sphingomonas sp. MMS12-HWE2-04]|uniref:phosphatase PAP2 family protein n=1 Tax=Sphingomonas sp. MMS12-HWE2-04 TaxID=3234199 RepID=UPI0038506E58